MDGNRGNQFDVTRPYPRSALRNLADELEREVGSNEART